MTGDKKPEFNHKFSMKDIKSDKKPEFSDKDLKVHVRHVLLHEFLRGSKPSTVIKELYEFYGREVMCQRTIKRWFTRFGKGDFSLLDKPKLGKRKLDRDRFSDFVANNYSVSNKDLAEVFDVSPETIRKYRTKWDLNSKGETIPQQDADDTGIANTTGDMNGNNKDNSTSTIAITELDNILNAADTVVEDMLPNVDNSKESDPCLSHIKANSTISNETDTVTQQNTTEKLEGDGLSDSSG